MSDTIVWTPDQRDALAAQYRQALANHEDGFLFDGHLIATAYAKWLLDDLNKRLPVSTKQAEAVKPRRAYARSRGGR